MDMTVDKWGNFADGCLLFQGLYDLHIRMMGIPLLPWEPPELSYDIQAKYVI